MVFAAQCLATILEVDFHCYCRIAVVCTFYGRGGFSIEGDDMNATCTSSLLWMLLVCVFVEFGVVIAADEDAHLVVIDLAELVEVQAGDDGVFFVQVALGMQVFAKAGADIVLRLEPFDFLRLKIAFVVDDTHITLQAVFVLQQFFDTVIELEKGADKYQPVLGTFDQFFKKVIGR